MGRDNITIRHSIPMPASSPDSNDVVQPSREPPEPHTGSRYLLRSNSLHSWDDVSELRIDWPDLRKFMTATAMACRTRAEIDVGLCNAIRNNRIFRYADHGETKVELANRFSKSA